MKNNFSLKFNLFDVFILTISLVVAVLSMIVTNSLNSKSLDTIQIQLNNKVIKEIDYSSITSTTTYTLTVEEYPNLLGDVEITIDPEKGVCVSDVTCPNHNCEKQGWIKMVGYPIVCVPNRLIITIVSEDSGYDIIG